MGRRGRFGFLLLLLAGGALVTMATRIDEASGFDSDRMDPGELLTATFEDQGLVSSSRALTVIGGVVGIVGLVGFARSFAEDPTDPNADSPLSAFEGMAGLPGALGALGGSPGAPGTGGGFAASPAMYGGPDPFDPTTWDHAAGVLWTFQGRSPLAFFDLVKEIRDASGDSLLVAALQDLEDRERRLVVALGTDSAVASFEPTLRAELHRRVGQGLDWDRVRPDAQVQPRSYDPSWTLADDGPYKQLRAQLRGARFRVLASA